MTGIEATAEDLKLINQIIALLKGKTIEEAKKLLYKVKDSIDATVKI